MKEKGVEETTLEIWIKREHKYFCNVLCFAAICCFMSLTILALATKTFN